MRRRCHEGPNCLAWVRSWSVAWDRRWGLPLVPEVVGRVLRWRGMAGRYAQAIFLKRERVQLRAAADARRLAAAVRRCDYRRTVHCSDVS